MMPQPSEQQSQAAPLAAPDEVVTPTTHLSGRALKKYALWFLIASIAGTLVWGAVGAILLPNQVQALEFGQYFTGADATVDLTALTSLRDAVAGGTAVATADQQRQLDLLVQFDASRAQSLSLINTLGVLGTMFVQPVVGVFSDRTRSRLGRRAPWILYGGILGALFLAGLRFAPSVAVLALLWTVAQAVLNLASGPINVTVADRVAEANRGTISAIGGLGAFLGGIVGVVVVGAAFATLGLNSYFLIAIIVAAGMAGFVWGTKDQPSTDLQVAPFSWGAFFRGMLIPLRDSDFRWVWIARIILIFGYSTSSALGFFMLQSYIRPGLSAAEATAMTPILSLVGLPGTILALIIAGRLSDKLGRRKPFVIGSSLLFALSFLILLISPTMPALIIQGILSGIAFGMYLPIDQALFVDVLPDKEAAGRDLGVASLGTNFGQALGPILAAQVVAITGGYGGVWLVAAILVLIAAVAILPVKRAR